MELGPADRLPARPARVLVAGTSGAGKTTLSARIAALTGAPHVEIDALFHGPGWTRIPTFVADVEAFSAQPAWVTEWQYSAVRDLLADRADLMVWLDLPRATVMRQVSVRTMRRRLGREVLWNGNVEPPLRTILTDREHIVRWAWDTHHKTALRITALATRRPALPVVRLRHRRDVDRWVDGPLRRAAGPA
ncbi:AAA family ATPase [Pseudonocardia benzenivorans]|uniref:AAA family ATPase n=1 Tax=Pseudonocardia benzenivorans TaxID=228005 RepID=A0ABW3VL20_9PSEU